MVSCIGNDGLEVVLFSNASCDSIEPFFGCDGKSSQGLAVELETLSRKMEKGHVLSHHKTSFFLKNTSNFVARLLIIVMCFVL